jgi:hypothetical protein
MQADFSVELGADDPVLEIPWASADGRQRYYDLRRQPDLLLYIEEAARERALGEFLEAINARGSLLQTVKCDAWFSRELNPEEAIYRASGKFGSYVDLVFAADEPRLSFAQHEELAQRLSALLQKAPEISAAAEFIIRRAYFRGGGAAEAAPGFYLSFYCFGYDDEESGARKRWTIALKLAENVILQWSAEQQKTRQTG